MIGYGGTDWIPHGEDPINRLLGIDLSLWERPCECSREMILAGRPYEVYLHPRWECVNGRHVFDGRAGRRRRKRAKRALRVVNRTFETLGIAMRHPRFLEVMLGFYRPLQHDRTAYRARVRRRRHRR